MPYYLKKFLTNINSIFLQPVFGNSYIFFQIVTNFTNSIGNDKHKYKTIDLFLNMEEVQQH